MSRPSVQPWVMVPKGELHSWGIDYLRVTSKSDAGKKAILLAWAKHKTQLERLGDTTKKGGIQGFTGERCGPLFYGRKEGIFMLQASGGLADELFPALPWDELHTTRLDVQVTLQYDEDESDLAARLGRQRAEPFLKQNKLPDPVQDLHIGWGRGDTLSLGSRSSPRFGRIYDKGRESKDERYTRCWRFEIEYKDPVADNVVAFLRSAESLDHAVAGSVAGQLAAWGLSLTTPARPVLVAGSIGRREFDSERSLKWLATQVRPSIEKLLATVDEETICEALGLPVQDRIAEEIRKRGERMHGPGGPRIELATWARKDK